MCCLKMPSKFIFARNLMENGDPMKVSKHSVAVFGSLFFVTFSALGAKGYEEALRMLTLNPNNIKN